MDYHSYPATRQKIFLAASELFSRSCYADIGVREIADKAGVKVPTVYNHYQSKEAILDDLFQYCADRISQFYESFPDVNYEQDPMECFRKMIIAFEEDSALMQRLIRITLNEQYRSFHAAGIIYDIMLQKSKQRYYDYFLYLKTKGVIKYEGIESFAEILARIGITFAMQFSRDEEPRFSLGYHVVMMDVFDALLKYSPPKDREEESRPLIHSY
ncbi:MAG: TetR/AcrR family transcriptional regulator [Planctomycetaceae bacterium]|nr:TetR/AcrR family transcriptional regulator [Planctomycetaceae bacterium]